MNLRILVLMLLLFARSTTACSHPAEIAPADPPPIVAVVSPNRGNAVRSITLPGDMVGFYESSLYAKVTGYLQSISVDKGDWVKKGEVLANIEVPELQQRVARSEASLAVQRLTYQRLEQVWKSDPRLVARQDVDIAQGKYLEAKADVDELQALVYYTRIIAPFNGIITWRFDQGRRRSAEFQSRRRFGASGGDGIACRQSRDDRHHANLRLRPARGGQLHQARNAGDGDAPGPSGTSLCRRCHTLRRIPRSLDAYDAD
jgi:Biotin-lipoyl like